MFCCCCVFGFFWGGGGTILFLLFLSGLVCVHVLTVHSISSNLLGHIIKFLVFQLKNKSAYYEMVAFTVSVLHFLPKEVLTPWA